MPDNSPLSRRELISLIDAIVSGAREINKYKLTEKQKNFYHSSHMACLSLVKYAPAMVRLDHIVLLQDALVDIQENSIP